MFKIKKSVFKTAHLPLRFQKISCYLYFFCLHCCLINILNFDYSDSRLSGLFPEVPTSPDNRGSTVPVYAYLLLLFCLMTRQRL